MRLDTRATGKWLSCGRCRELVYAEHFARDQRICPYCGHHDRLTARERLGTLLDPSPTPIARTDCRFCLFRVA